MLDSFWVCFVLTDCIFFIEVVIYKRVCNAVMSDCPSNDKKYDSKDNWVS